MNGRNRRHHRLERSHTTSFPSWRRPGGPAGETATANAVVDCGWGRLIFAQTFADNAQLAEALRQEEPGQRDIAFYLRDPHVVLAFAPQELFLDPSHTYRLWLDQYRPSPTRPKGFVIRKMHTRGDAAAINRIYAARGMVTVDNNFLWGSRKSRIRTYLVAEDSLTGTILGTVTGMDHRLAFDDPENGSSLWCLAVDPQAPHPGIGQALVRHLAEHYLARGRAFMDLSVMHDNEQAIALYEQLGFQRVHAFTLKRKNPINEPLFMAPDPDEERLNIYAQILVKEARRRGVVVDVLDAEAGYFSLTLGARTIVCRESLSELTSAVAMSRCDDKAVTRRLLEKAGLRVPVQQKAGAAEENAAFLERFGRIVVKPARGEQGTAVRVDLRTPEEVEEAIAAARQVADAVLLEELVEGQDLRIIVIDFKVVAAAVRKPAQVTGTGQHSIAQLIEKQSRRRAAATGGESRIPTDAETERCVRSAGYAMDSVLPAGETLLVRKTANLHTGGTIHDVTAKLHPVLAKAAEAAARAINIPVVGLDFMVPAVDGEDYAIIEANERPGLANHEPQPTAERFIDLLFPQTAGVAARG